MRKFIIVAIVLVAIGVGASFYLIPSKTDVSNLQARDQKAVAAGQVDVEAEYNAGRRSFPIISGLADKRITQGNRPAAIQILEDYVKVNPTDVQGHKKLAEQYQLAGRQADYNAQLELIAAADPTEANLRVLSDIYNADKNYPKQVEVLKKIVAVTNGSNAQTFVDLATIQVVVGDKDGALATLADLKTKHPEFSSYPVVRIQVSILSEKGKADDAFAIAKQWIDAPHPIALATPAANVPPSADPKAVVSAPVPAQANEMAKELADLCNILHYSGHADKAVALVEPHIDLLQQSTELVVAYVNANITAGRDEHAYQILAKIDEANKMTPELYIPYMQLAIKREDIAKAEDIAKRLDPVPFNEEQSLNLIETARASNAPTVTAILLERFNTPEFLNGKPVLTAVISILKNEKDQDKKIEVALNMQLSSVQRVRLAEACARASKTPCFDAIVKQYPPIEQMTTQQIAEYAQLYIIANRPTDIIDKVGLEAAKPNAHPDVLDAHRRLAAAAGRQDIMKPWLEANANNAPFVKLQEYFFLANDRHQHVVATDIAERMYARDPSPMSRDLMIAAFMDAGSYDRALPYLREQIKQEGASDGLYLNALSKLARKDPKARKELTDYALASLQSNKGDARAQLNYAYVLINNGQKDKALPFAKQYAVSRGGEWKKMYAQLTFRPAKGGTVVAAPKLSREQLVAMAHNPSINSANKRQIAFQLLNDSDKPDATAIFADLAKDKSPDSQEVKDLLYMWGGKLNSSQIAWVQGRAANASPYDKQRWGDLINSTADDYAVLQYVSATPDALYNKNLRQRYFRVLATQGGGQNFDVAMRGWVMQTTDVPALVDYGKIAQAYGYKDAATATWQRVLSLEPGNEIALNQMSSAAMAKGSYSAANQYVDRYISAVSSNPQPQTNPAQAHFYKASLLKRQGNIPAAQQEFGEVVRLTQATADTAPDALSRLYTAEFNLGYHQQAKAGFEQLLAQHPDDKGILADYMSALIEFKYYDDATRIANQYDKSSPYYHQSALMGTSAHVSQIESLSGGRELKISFDAPIEGAAPVDIAQANTLPWVESSTLGYDSMTVSAKPGYVVRYMPTADQQFAVVGTPAEYQQMAAVDRDQELRLQLLYAQIEQQTGQTDKAKQRLAALQQYYPDNTQVITSEAAIESANGNNYRAQALLRQAQSISPENEDIPLQMQALHRASSINYAKIDHEYRSIGNNNEEITTLSGAVAVGDQTEIGMNVKNDFLNSYQIRRPRDGLVSNYNTTRQQGELYVAQHLDGGDRAQVSAFANNETAGGGAYYAFNDALGRTQVLAEYHKPYWDFVEAVYDSSVRDRVGFTHAASITPTLSLGVEGSLNNYAIPGDHDAAQTGLIRLSLVQEINHANPYFGVGYGLDAEYLFRDPDRKTAPSDGALYEPFPFRDREVHFFSGILQDDLTSSTHALLVGGWAFDRLNRSGPVVEGRLNQDLTEAWEAGVRARYGFEANNTNNNMINVGADLMYKF